MKPRTILVRTLEGFAASRPVQVLPRSQIKGENLCARHPALAWFATAVVLSFTNLACRKPAEATHKAAVQIARPQNETGSKDADLKRGPAGQWTDRSVQPHSPPSAEVNARKDPVQSTRATGAVQGKEGSGPVSQVVKVVTAAPPPQPIDAGKDSKPLRATAEHPANQAAFVQVARSDTDQDRPMSVGGKDGQALPPTAKATQRASGPDALDGGDKHPADQAALAQVALKDRDWSVRRAAVEGLTDQGVLARIALVDLDLDIRKLAVSLLTDQAALARISSSDKDWSVRMSAVNKLTNRSALAEVATKDKDPDIRKLAVSRLIHPITTPKAEERN